MYLGVQAMKECKIKDNDVWDLSRMVPRKVEMPCTKETQLVEPESMSFIADEM